MNISWPEIGTGAVALGWRRFPAPTVKVSAAAPPLTRQAMTAGRFPSAPGKARSGDAAVADRAAIAPARANGAGKPPDACGETARARMASLAVAPGPRKAGGGSPGIW